MCETRTPMLRQLGAALCGAIILSISPPAVHAQTVGAMSAGTARIWFYRDYEPYVSRNYATVRLNGVVAGSVDPYGGSAVYRDIPPGRYHLSVESYGKDVNQDADVDLAAGQEAYVKIVNSPSWANDVDISAFQRDTYYLRLMPAQLARAEMGRRSF